MASGLWRMVVVALLLAQPLLAQVTTGTVLGTVRDETGAMVPGVTVTL